MLLSRHEGAGRGDNAFEFITVSLRDVPVSKYLLGETIEYVMVKQFHS